MKLKSKLMSSLFTLGCFLLIRIHVAFFFFTMLIEQETKVDVVNRSGLHQEVQLYMKNKLGVGEGSRSLIWFLDSDKDARTIPGVAEGSQRVRVHLAVHWDPRRFQCLS